jgi:hypothetical protein
LIRQILLWIAKSFQEENGKTSGRRMTAFALTNLNIYMIVFDKIPEDYRVNIYYANLAVISLILGVLTIDHVISIIHKNEKL